MAGKGEVANDVVDLSLILHTKLFDDGVVGAAGFALEVQELHDGDGAVAGVVEDVGVVSNNRYRPSSPFLGGNAGVVLID